MPRGPKKVKSQSFATFEKDYLERVKTTKKATKKISPRWKKKKVSKKKVNKKKVKITKKRTISKSSHAKNIARRYPMSTALGTGTAGVAGYAALAGHSP